MYNVYWVCLMYVFVQIAQNMKVIIYIHISQANMLGELITLSGNGKKENMLLLKPGLLVGNNGF